MAQGPTGKVRTAMGVKAKDRALYVTVGVARGEGRRVSVTLGKGSAYQSIRDYRDEGAEAVRSYCLFPDGGCERWYYCGSGESAWKLRDGAAAKRLRDWALREWSEHKGIEVVKVSLASMVLAAGSLGLWA